MEALDVIIPVLVGAVAAAGSWLVAQTNAKAQVTSQVMGKLLADSEVAEEVHELRAVIAMLVFELHHTREVVRNLGGDPEPLPPMLLKYLQPETLTSDRKSTD